ncbi:hypothetical protein ACT3SZ_07790 [Corynebacterium sp. AOP40-9SA-29]|uniref:hypothetical protein n=1 Tax=Corynebacterium sp. AOP40-9SA-29 TaxID=3457677 RepID=UPI004033A6B4
MLGLLIRYAGPTKQKKSGEKSVLTRLRNYAKKALEAMIADYPTRSDSKRLKNAPLRSAGPHRASAMPPGRGERFRELPFQPVEEPAEA